MKRVGPGGTGLEEEEGLVRVPAVPGHEVLHEVAVAHDHGGHEHHLGHVLQVTVGDDVLEVEGLARRDDEGQHHREAAEDRAGHEVGREHRGVPAGEQRHGEVEAHDGVHREHERGGEPRQDQVADPVVLPVARGALPTQREHAVGDALGLLLGGVPQGGEVGNEPQVPEEQRDGEVGRHREHVPDERALEVRPHAHGVRDTGRASRWRTTAGRCARAGRARPA